MQLSKSQRIAIIQNIARRLENEEWENIDLILSQFSLPTKDVWAGGNKRSYVIDIAKDAKNEVLIEIQEHLGIQFDILNVLPSFQANLDCWEEGRLRVFLSHLAADRLEAAKIKESLKPYGMSLFVAHDDIIPTSEWQNEIEKALSSCDLLVALIQPKTIESKWCDQEIGYALGRSVPVFTVSCGAVPHGFVSRFQAINGNQKLPKEIAKNLFEAAIKHKNLEEKMAHVLINLFKKSLSFARAKELITYLEELTVWDDSFPDILKEALEKNDQISGSFQVPSRVAKLIEKWRTPSPRMRAQ